MKEGHPALQAILNVRHKAAGNFSPEFSGNRGQDYDRGVMDAYQAVYAVLFPAPSQAS